MTPGSQVIQYLHEVGISKDACTAYIALFEAGPSSALQLSRQTAISRTHVYRCLDELKKFNLVSAEQLGWGTVFRALPVENLESTFLTREVENVKQKEGLAAVRDMMYQLAGSEKVDQATVKHYYGLAGIKQANWNLTKAEKEFFVFEVSHITDHFGTTWGRKLRERTIERGLISHDLTNSKIITKSELEPYDPEKTHYRHIDPAILDIQFEMYIYNTTITLLDYSPGSMQSIELENPAFNSMMRQVYGALWNMATPISLA